VRPRRTWSTECGKDGFGHALCRSAGSELLERDALGFPTRNVSGNVQAGAVVADAERVTTMRVYEHDGAYWQLGMVTDEKAEGATATSPGSPSRPTRAATRPSAPPTRPGGSCACSSAPAP
jgi:hypothetical protein